jgi:hypothetical protein
MIFPVSFLQSIQDDDSDFIESLTNGMHPEKFKKSLSYETFLPKLKGLEDVLEFRDAAEDIITDLGISKDFSLPRDLLKQDQKDVYVAKALYTFVMENLQIKRPWCKDYIDFVWTSICDEWLDNTDPSITLKPRIKTPLSELEAVIQEIETQAPFATRVLCKLWANKLQCPSIVPVVAILYCILKGIDLDDTFIHCPPTTIVGAPCMWRDSEVLDPVSNIVSQTKKQIPDFTKLIFLTDGKIHYKNDLTDGTEYSIIQEPLAYYGAWVPGVDVPIQNVKRKYLVLAKNSTACIYAVSYTDDKKVLFNKKAEFDLDEQTPITYLDCQRDRDANIVVLWGHFNNNTGSVSDVSYFAWTEEDFIARKSNTQTTTKLPNRSIVNTKVDYRDHGNLLSLVTDMKECQQDKIRYFSYNQAVVFGNIQLPIFIKDTRFLHVYGSPLHFIVLGSNGTLYEIKLVESSYSIQKCSSQKPNVPVRTITSMLALFS